MAPESNLVIVSASPLSSLLPEGGGGKQIHVGSNLGNPNPKFDLGRNNEVSSSLKFRPLEFLSLKESCHLKPRKRKYGSPFDTDD